MSEAATPDPDGVGQALLDLIGPPGERPRRQLRSLLRQSPAPSGRIARRFAIARIDDPRFVKNARLSLEDIHLSDSLPYGFVEIADAVVTPFGFVVAGDHLVLNCQFLPDGWMRGLDNAPDLTQRLFDANFIHKFDVWREEGLMSLPADMEEIDGPAFLFNSRIGFFNFAHLVHDTLIQAPSFGDCRDFAGSPVKPLIAGPGFRFPVMAELFRRAVGGADPLFLRGRFVRVSRLFVPTTHFLPWDNAIARGAALRLTRTLASSLRPYRQAKPRRLFISRADSGRGEDREPRFSNEDALRRALAGLGIEPVVASDLRVEDYLRLFVNAELLVGLHGAGLLNLLLCARPRMLELTVARYPSWHSLRLFMETGMGAPYARVAMPAPKDGFAEYDIPRIVEACRALLATPCPDFDSPL